MKQNSLSVPIVGGGIAFLCFFFPWIKLDMSALGLGDALPQVKVNLSVSGFKYATGTANLTTLAFLAALAILGVCIYMMSQKTPWKSRTIVLISSGIGLLFVLFKLIQFIPGLNPQMDVVSGMLKSIDSDANIGNLIHLQFGGFGTAIGFIIALIGGWNIPKSDISMEDNHQEAIP
jgi:hypothetical protein